MNRGFLSLVLVLFASHLFGQDSVRLVNKWKLVSYGAFEKVRNSPAYLMADEETAKKYEETVKVLLDSVYYDFKSDKTLVYVDLENSKPTQRRARWSLDNGDLLIVETDRPYMRKARILKLTDQELMFSPVIDGEVGESPMTFVVVP